jgi:hypothetical protein
MSWPTACERACSGFTGTWWQTVRITPAAPSNLHGMTGTRRTGAELGSPALSEAQTDLVAGVGFEPIRGFHD